MKLAECEIVRKMLCRVWKNEKGKEYEVAVKVIIPEKPSISVNLHTGGEKGYTADKGTASQTATKVKVPTDEYLWVENPKTKIDVTINVDGP